MADLTRLTAQLWTGGAVEDDEDVQELLDAGITADIDLRRADDLNAFGPVPGNAADLLDAHSDIDYLHNPTYDDGAPKPVDWFQRSWDFALPILTDGGVVLAHCLNGINRGPSTAFFLLRAFYGMDADEAFRHIVTRRPIATLRYAPDADGALIAMDLATGARTLTATGAGKARQTG